MVRIAALLFTFAFVLAACESPNTRDSTTDKQITPNDLWQEVKKRFVGYSESELISSWGIPDDTYETSDGTRILEYKVRNNLEVEGEVLWSEQEGYGSQHTTLRQCSINFILRDQVVSSINQTGNDCPDS